MLAPGKFGPTFRRKTDPTDRINGTTSSLIVPSFFSIFLDFVLEGLIEVFGVEAGDADERAVGRKQPSVTMACSRD